MNHDDARELIAAYALDAVDAIERVQMQAHLETCERCTDLLREHLEAAGLLGLSSEPQSPPKGLRSRVMKQVATDGGRKVVQQGSRSSSRRPRWSVIALGIALTLVVVGTILLAPGRFGGEGSGLNDEIVAVLGSESLESIPLLSTREVPGAAGQVYLTKDSDTGVVVVTGLVDPKSSSYLIWVLVRETAVPLGTIEVAEERAVLIVRNLPEENEGFLITVEDDPLTRVPKGPPVLRSLPVGDVGSGV